MMVSLLTHFAHHYSTKEHHHEIIKNNREIGLFLSMRFIESNAKAHQMAMEIQKYLPKNYHLQHIIFIIQQTI